MKLYVKANSDTGYLYIFKHGVGPGTVPGDVVFLKEKDLPNGYTAVWLDRFLTTDELKQYDIPSETRINELLRRIGYCQKNGDVVPCDNVMASTLPIKDIKLLAKAAVDCTTKDELAGVISGLDSVGLRKLFLHYMEMLRDDSLSVAYIASQLSDELMSYYVNVDACDKITASKDISCYKKYADALAKQGYSKNKFLKSLKEDFTDKDLEDLVNDEADLHAYIAGFILNSTGKHDYKAQEEASKLADEIISAACDKVTASMEFYVDQGAGLGEPGKKFTEDELKELYYHLCIHEGDEICNSYPSFEAWLDDSLESGLIRVDFIEDDDVDYPYTLTADEFDVESEYFDDIESCDKVTASTHRYSAGRIEEDGTEDFYYDTGFDSYDEAWDWGTNHDCTHIYDRESGEFTSIESCDNVMAASFKQNVANHIGRVKISDFDQYIGKDLWILVYDLGVKYKGISNLLMSYIRILGRDGGTLSVNILDDNTTHFIKNSISVRNDDVDEWESYLSNQMDSIKYIHFGRFDIISGEPALTTSEIYSRLGLSSRIEATTDSKYFANMVSASSDSYRYLIRGYYDQSRRGLAEDSWADTISEVDEIVNEYANKGYYLEVRNLETGTVLEFSADNWFDEIYPDGGFSAIPGAID